MTRSVQCPDNDEIAPLVFVRHISVVEDRSESHEVIRALHGSDDGNQRVPKMCSESSSLSRVIIGRASPISA